MVPKVHEPETVRVPMRFLLSPRLRDGCGMTKVGPAWTGKTRRSAKNLAGINGNGNANLFTLEGGMNRKRITLTLVVLLTLFVLWRAFWRAAPCSICCIRRESSLACSADGCGFSSFLHWRGPALMTMLAALLLALYELRREHLDLLLLQASRTLNFVCPRTQPPRALIGFGFGCILGVSARLARQPVHQYLAPRSKTGRPLTRQRVNGTRHTVVTSWSNLWSCSRTSLQRAPPSRV